MPPVPGGWPAHERHRLGSNGKPGGPDRPGRAHPDPCPGQSGRDGGAAQGRAKHPATRLLAGGTVLADAGGDRPGRQRPGSGIVGDAAPAAGRGRNVSGPGAGPEPAGRNRPVSAGTAEPAPRGHTDDRRRGSRTDGPQPNHVGGGRHDAASAQSGLHLPGEAGSDVRHMEPSATGHRLASAAGPNSSGSAGAPVDAQPGTGRPGLARSIGRCAVSEGGGRPAGHRRRAPGRPRAHAGTVP